MCSNACEEATGGTAVPGVAGPLEPPTTLPQRLRGLGDLWGASAWTPGHPSTWENASPTDE